MLFRSNHPYNGEYLEVMKHPIFKHSVVHDWGGGKVSNTGEFPYRIAARKLSIIVSIMLDDQFQKKIRAYVNLKNIVIYGLGEIGKILVRQLDEAVQYVIDQNMRGNKYWKKDIFTLKESVSLRKDVCVIVTPLLDAEKIKGELLDIGYRKVLLIEELV